MRFLVFGLLFLTAVFVAESRSLVKRDVQDDIQKSIEQLRETVKKELDKLNAEGKTALATGLQKADQLLADLEAQVQKLDPSTEIGKTLLKTLEAALEKVKKDVEDEIKKLSGGYYEDTDVEAELVKSVTELYDNAVKAIETLAKSGKTELLNGLSKTIKFIQSIETKVSSLTPTTDLGKSVLELVSRLMKKGVDVLGKDYVDIQSGVEPKFDHKDEFVSMVREIYEKAKTAYETLEKSDKKTLKDALTKVVAVGKQIQTDLKTLNPTTDVGKAVFQGVQNLVDKVVAYLELQLKSIDTFYADDPVEDVLVKQASDLYDNVKKALETLSKTGKDKLVNGLQTAITFLQNIETKVKALKPNTVYGKTTVEDITRLIKKCEELLNKELKNAQSGITSHDNSKDELIKEVKTTYEKAKAAIEALEKSDKKTLKEGLSKVIEVEKQIQTELKALKPTTEIGKAIFDGLTTLADEAIAYLELRLKQIGTFYEDDAVEDELVKQASTLYDNVKKAIVTLSKSGKDKLVNGLQKAIAFVQNIETKVNALNPTTAYGKAVVEVINKLIKKGEELLNKELKNAQSGTTSNDNSKDELIKEIKDIYEKAKTAYEALEKSDKKTLKEALTKIVEVGKQIQTELKALNPSTDVGRAVFDGVQTIVNEVVAFLELKLKSIGSF